MHRKITMHIIAASIMLFAAMDADEPLAGSNTSQDSRVPSFARIDDALALEGKDEAVVKAALDEWRRAAATDDTARPFVERRQQEMTFVSAVAPSLDNRQLTNLVDLIVAQRPEQRGMRAHRGDGRHSHMERRHERRMGNVEERVTRHVGWMDAALELTDDQVTRVTAAMSTMTREQASIHEAREAGRLTREQSREQMRAARDAFDETLATILTAKQEKRLEILEPLHPGRRHHA